MKEYITPDFDVTIYDVKDNVALNISSPDPNGNDEDWFG